MKLKELFNKFRKKDIPIERSQYDELEDLKMEVINSRTRWADQWATEYSNDRIEFAICFFQLYEGCRWYEFVSTTKHYSMEFNDPYGYLSGNYDDVKSIEIEGLEGDTFEQGVQFTLRDKGEEYLCTIEHIIYDRINNKIFFKLDKSKK